MQATVIPGPPLGPGIETSSPEVVLAALGRFDLDMSWQTAGPTVVPMLPRWRAYPSETGDRVSVTLPPGIEVGFGLDLGPAVAFVVGEQVSRWGIDRVELVAAALTNVRRRAQRMRPRDVVQATIAGVPMRIVQTGEGVASALLLVADALPRLIGSDPQLLLAPMRDVLITLPPDVDPDFAAWLAVDFASADPNGLDVGLFPFEGGRVVRELIGGGAPPERSAAGLMH
ncbi:MAG: hypothetical protein A2V84_14340 [Chloroflexi bacterium RBG_16_70_13]|nr:MAG: hypothetical protein A2V84_14340 [Chloroflexi bacterium RBG_16_70_13]